MFTFLQRSVSFLFVLLFLFSFGYALVSAQTNTPPYRILLPIITNGNLRTIEGQVFTADLKPLAGVDIITSDGHRALTNAEGTYVLTELKQSEYLLIPTKDGYTFSPNTMSVSLPPDATGVNFTSSLVSCTDIILNGGFETSLGWELPRTEYPASYSPITVHSGTRSLRTGIVNPLDNIYSYSSGRQTVTIPGGIASANLVFFIYPQSTELTSKPEPPNAPLDTTIGESVLAGDKQYVVITDLTGTVKRSLVWQKSNSAAWQGYSFDMTEFAGQIIQIHFGTYNDGASGITSMYVDDVVLQICPSVTIPTPTPAPTTCGNLILNDSFETNLAWEIPITAYTAGYSTERAHTGTRSMRTGITDKLANRYSYSDAGQWVYIPSNAESATLSLWSYAISGETTFEKLPAIPTGLRYAELPQSSDVTLSGDVQYLLILDKYQYIIETLLWRRSNDQAWTQLTYDLKKYAGRVIKIQFGTYNDGYNGITSMFMDDATLSTCLPVPSPTPTPTQTPTPTPTVKCSDIILNGGLETTSTWIIPLTTYPAAYSTEQAHTGLRSMLTGILNPAINIYSYSDARQTVIVPVNAVSAKLNFYAYTYSGESPSRPVPEIPSSSVLSEVALSEDVQYLLVLDAYQYWIDTLLWQRNNNQSWVGYTFDLMKYAGKMISLQFGTFNNGYDGRTYMFFDEVSLTVCTP